MHLVVLLLVSVCLYAILKICFIIRIRLQLKAIPQPPLDNVFYGHLNTVQRAKHNNTFLDLLVEWTETYGDTILFWMKLKPFLFTSNATYLQQITTDLQAFIKVEKLPNRSLFQQRIVGLNSILSGNGIMWAIKRKAMSKWFAKTNMESLFHLCKPHMDGTQISRLRQKVGVGCTVELIEELGVIFTSYLHVLGCSELLAAEKVAKNVAKILELIPLQLGMSMEMLRAKFSGEKAAVVDMIKEMRSNIHNLVWDKLQKIENIDDGDSVDNHDLLAYLCIANKNVVSSSTTNKVQTANIADQMENTIDDVMTVCLVMDNLVKQLGSLFIVLADNPHVKEKLFQELRNNPITEFDSLQKLVYTEKCLLESLRFSPALLRGTRNTNGLSHLGPYYIPTNQIQVMYSQYVLHRSKRYWTNPDQFDPDRWYDGFVPPPYSYMPFFVGPRSCIGKHFAMLCMKLTLSSLVNNFEFTPKFDPEKLPVIDQSMAVMRIRNRLDYNLLPRGRTNFLTELGY